MINAIKIDPNLTAGEKNYFSISYKNSIYMRKANLRKLQYFQVKALNDPHLNLLKAYREKLQEELLNICYEYISILDSFLIPNAKDQSLLIGYYKI